jgi:hypothetical protein
MCRMKRMKPRWRRRSRNNWNRRYFMPLSDIYANC